MVHQLRPAMIVAALALSGCRTAEPVYYAPPAPPAVQERQAANFEGWMLRCQSKAGIVGEVFLGYQIDPVTGARLPLGAQLAPNVNPDQKRMFDKCLADDSE